MFTIWEKFEDWTEFDLETDNYFHITSASHKLSHIYLYSILMRSNIVY